MNANLWRGCLLRITAIITTTTINSSSFRFRRRRRGVRCVMNVLYVLRQWLKQSTMSKCERLHSGTLRGFLLYCCCCWCCWCWLCNIGWSELCLPVICLIGVTWCIAVLIIDSSIENVLLSTYFFVTFLFMWLLLQLLFFACFLLIFIVCKQFVWWEVDSHLITKWVISKRRCLTIYHRITFISLLW